jgi:hypothetical protein
MQALTIRSESNNNELRNRNVVNPVCFVHSVKSLTDNHAHPISTKIGVLLTVGCIMGTTKNSVMLAANLIYWPEILG